MDELLQDFLIETGEHVEAVTSQLVEFEREPTNHEAIANIYRLVHTIKGTCGFLDLPRLEKLAHAAEALIGRVRDASCATPEAVTLILAAIDRIKSILVEIERLEAEPEGSDADLIGELEKAATAQPNAAPPAHLPTTGGAPASASDAGAAGAATKAGRDNAGIRVSVEALERIMRLVSELVLTRNQLLDVTRGETNSLISAPLQRLSSLTTDLQDGVMRARMQPIDRLFSKLPRLVRDLCVELDKKIDLVIEGADTELDRQLVEVLRDPLTHIVRNCADHGIEPPDAREAAGKPRAGCIHVRASHEAGLLIVEVADDGRGLDLARIRAKAEAVGLATAEDIAAMSAHEIRRFVFAAGFSTAASVTNVSGRGIGMDVVRSRIESVGGSVELSSTEGAGARFTIKLPLTLAIAPALVVRCAGQRFALPQQAVTEAVSIMHEGSSRLDFVSGALMARLRGEIMPIIDLRAVLGLPPLPDARAHDGLIVVVRTGRNCYGLLVDGVTDFQEIVVKPVGAALSHIPVYAGNTILGDGSVVLILDPNGVAAAQGIEPLDGLSAKAANDARQTPQREATTLLLFNTGAGPLKALPLSLISRIVTATRADLVHVDGCWMLRHQGALMPVIPICDPGDDGTRDQWPVLVAGVGGEPLGLLISEIVDVVAEAIEIDVAGATGGVIGSLIVRGKPTEMIDLAYYLQRARPEAFRRGHARKFAVLLVDDKAFFRDMLAPVIMAAGYDVTTAASGAEALALCERGHQFDAVVSDLEMPDMDGYSLARALRKEAGEGLPLIALDAHAGPAIASASLTAGFRCAVGKFDRQTLLKALGEALEGAAFNDAALEQRFASVAAKADVAA